PESAGVDAGTRRLALLAIPEISLAAWAVAGSVAPSTHDWQSSVRRYRHGGGAVRAIVRRIGAALRADELRRSDTRRRFRSTESALLAGRLCGVGALRNRDHLRRRRPQRSRHTTI